MQCGISKAISINYSLSSVSNENNGLAHFVTEILSFVDACVAGPERCTFDPRSVAGKNDVSEGRGLVRESLEVFQKADGRRSQDHGSSRMRPRLRTAVEDPQGEHRWEEGLALRLPDRDGLRRANRESDLILPHGDS